jgi:hypothetical protein
MSSWLSFATAAPSNAVATLQVAETWGRPTLTTVPLGDRRAGECAAGWHLGIAAAGRGLLDLAPAVRRGYSAHLKSATLRMSPS